MKKKEEKKDGGGKRKFFFFYGSTPAQCNFRHRAGKQAAVWFEQSILNKSIGQNLVGKIADKADQSQSSSTYEFLYTTTLL